jgi:hypothetical protein
VPRRVFWVLFTGLVFAGLGFYLWGLMRGGDAWRDGPWPMRLVGLSMITSVVVVVSAVTDLSRQRRQREAARR